MYYKLKWDIRIGKYRLGMLDSLEIHKSVDLLAANCTIKLPASVYNVALKIEDENGNRKIKRGDKILVRAGYDDESSLKEEFRGYLKTISTDDGTITIECEDELFRLRKQVANKEFVKTDVKTIAQYLIDQTEMSYELKLNCTLTINYDKFVIHNATAFDVLKKLKDETAGNIYLKDNELHIHPPYLEHFGSVRYSFQKNIEKSDLKYRNADDKAIEVVVEYVDSSGQKKSFNYGTTGGERHDVNGNGISEADLKQLAANEYDKLNYDGYEGSITGWLVPYVTPGYIARVEDRDYEYKDGNYYVVSVTTTISESGGVRKVELGRRML